MTNYFYYCIAGQSIDSTSKLYKVGFGTTVQGRRDYLYLMTIAKRKNYYCEPITVATTDFITRLCDKNTEFPLRCELISARNLVRSLKKNTTYPLSTDILRNTHFMRKTFDLDYRVSCNLAAREKRGMPAG